MRVVRLVFGEETELHIWSRHRVTIQEVEAAIYQPGSVFVVRGRAEGIYNVCGRSENGRYLTMIVRNLGEGAARLITARDMSPSERRRYERHTAH